ncbi:uncharacterized protein LOC132201362 [Neocloeon triangulifer]|uniref:uncharacterized protein LOC132201362 n=1 Tax=Neocloeon triangulifer TaxID=2078957 RepID=UPI00286F356A|nr:uncharacterized protein LOC132201362 [Neocloeon triangulifer]
MDDSFLSGLEKIRKQMYEADSPRKSLNKLRVSVNQQCDRISSEASDITSKIREVQEGINKNAIAVNQELAAFRKATEAEMRMEDRDRKIEIDFEKKAQFIEDCREEIERLENGLMQYDEVIKEKENEAVVKLNSLRNVTKCLGEYSGVYWDFANCNQEVLSGYVKSKAFSRIRPFEISIVKNNRLEVAEELWSIIEELNSQ